MRIIAGVTSGMYTSQSIPRVNVAPDYLKLYGNKEITNNRQPSYSMASLSFPKLRAMDGADLAVRLDVFLNTIWTLRSPMLGWAGVMQMVQNGIHLGKSAITFLPVIDMSPSDMTCIYSTLEFACKFAKENETTPIITFDQSVYWKAYTIIANEPQGSVIKTVVLRLGGFHLKMSYRLHNEWIRSATDTRDCICTKCCHTHLERESHVD